MKKKFVLIIVCVMLCLAVFSGCEDARMYLSEEECQEVAQVHLIYYDNPDVKTLHYRAPRTIPFNFDKMTIIETMSKENLVKFKEVLPKKEISLNVRDGKHDSPQGYSLMIVFNNGNFIVACFDEIWYAGKFSSDGTLLEYYSMMLLRVKVSINPFFETQLPDNY